MSLMSESNGSRYDFRLMDGRTSEVVEGEQKGHVFELSIISSTRLSPREEQVGGQVMEACASLMRSKGQPMFLQERLTLSQDETINFVESGENTTEEIPSAGGCKLRSPAD